ncbi:MAG: stage V sporulation protein D [Firmicutes bacterium]|nr:stage V sporulation protein D [Bacillota bacterium]
MQNSKARMKLKKRMYYTLSVCMLLLVLLIGRTGYLQIARGDQLQKQAVEQQTRDRIINSKRGTIFDRNGKPLAVSASVETVTASPSEVRENSKVAPTEKVAAALAEILELDYDFVHGKITRESSYEIIKRRIEKEKADKVRQFITENKVVGIRLDADTKRFYPYASLAAHVIGFTGLDNQGLEGIEMVFDKNLKGSPGRIISAKNAAGIEMPFKYEKLVNPQDGLNVVLTIDETIQRFAEKHLETALIENKLLKGGACIVLDPKSGEVLAMTTKPDFDLNNPFDLQDESIKKQLQLLDDDARSKANEEELRKMWRNKAVVDSYEPGSTFKIFTAAMALEEKVVSLNDTFFCTGSKKVASHNIRCWKAGGHGSQTFVEGVKNSCNPVFIEVGARIGAVQFMNYFTGLGFTQKTGIELPGEAPGIFHTRAKFNEVELATSSFGQSFQITPLQMISGVAAIANGGQLMRPHLVKSLTDSNDNIVTEFESEMVRQVISKETSDTLCWLLEKVVADGTGSGAYIKGFRVAGKTGTSEKLPRGSGKYVASFAGFAPADDPQVVCLVILDEPSSGLYYGGQIASPVVRSILEDTLNYLGIEPAYTAEEKATLETSVPTVAGQTIKDAKSALSNQNLKAKVIGQGDTVLSQIPKGGIKVNQQSTITLYTEEYSEPVTVTVPNVLQNSVLSASDIILKANLNIKVVGAGASPEVGGVTAYKQDPPAGTVVEAGTIVTVEFRRIEAGE